MVLVSPPPRYVARVSALTLALLAAACGGHHASHHDDVTGGGGGAPGGDPHGAPTGPEQLGDWIHRDVPADVGGGVDLHGVSSDIGPGLLAVGDRGTIVASSDEGQSWTRRDVGTDAALEVIGYVDALVYVGGDHVVLMSKDRGAHFVTAGGIDGHVRALTYTDGVDGGAFWAVGDEGRVWRAGIGETKIEDVDPAALVWTARSLPGAGGLTGVSFSFDDGIVVGAHGYVGVTTDGGKTFRRSTQPGTQADLHAIDGNAMGGDGVLARRDPISGAPVGSFSWSQHEATDLPSIRALACIDDCLATATDLHGALLVHVTDRNEIDDTLASGIHARLDALTHVVSGRYVAVGAAGTVLLQTKARVTAP